jgi:hypothetical protein
MLAETCFRLYTSDLQHVCYLHVPEQTLAPTNDPRVARTALSYPGRSRAAILGFIIEHDRRWLQLFILTL